MFPAPHTARPSLQSPSLRLLRSTGGTGGTLFERQSWLTGLFGLQPRGIVVWLRDEVRGHGPERRRHRPDHNRRLITMHCCRAPAVGVRLHFHQRVTDENSGPPTTWEPVRRTWLNVISLMYSCYIPKLFRFQHFMCLCTGHSVRTDVLANI